MSRELSILIFYDTEPKIESGVDSDIKNLPNMSSKTSKRRTRRVNTNEEEEKRQPDPEIIDISDDWSTTSNETEKTEKDDLIKEIKDEPTEEKKENGENPVPEENGQSNEDPQEVEITNGQLEIAANLTIQNSPTPEENSDIEPLVMDTEEPELQLPSETGSETSEIEKSPVLNRCMTRRSQSKNAPTPKTPKTLDYNGENEKIPRLDEDPDENVSVDTSVSDKTDLTNVSTAVNVGDTTRNNDITTTTINDELNVSSFIEITKDKSYGETLRCLTGRKTVRAQHYNYQPRFYNSNIDISSKDRLDGHKSYSMVPQCGVKRKLESDSPAEFKKSKIEDSPGFFSYLSSPFKSKKDIPSSTPKLTGFKFVHPNAIDEVEKIDEFEKNKEPKKWCSVM